MKSSIKSLTWKYFWEQKIEEIGENIEYLKLSSIAIAAIFQFGWMGVNPVDGSVMLMSEGGVYLCQPLAVIGLGIMGFWLLVGLITVIYMFINWISDNWTEASERAERDLKRKKNL